MFSFLVLINFLFLNIYLFPSRLMLYHLASQSQSVRQKNSVRYCASNLPRVGGMGLARIGHLLSWAQMVSILQENREPLPFSHILNEFTIVALEMCFLFIFIFYCLPSVSSSFAKSCFTHPRCFEQSPWVKIATDAAIGCCHIWLVSLWKEQRGIQVGVSVEA